MTKNAIRYPIYENSYNKEIKRFINRDVVSGEITNSGSLNRYCYVQGNPVSLTDPFGLCPDSNSAFKNLCSNLYHMDWNAVGHAALDVAGIFFDGADVINAIWYACEGNMEMAAASAVSAIPALGMATGNLLMKSNKLAAAGKAVKAIAKMTQGVMGVCAGIEMAKTGFTNFLDGLEAGTFDAGAFLQTLGGIGIAMLSGKGLASSGRELLACEEGLSQLWNSAKSKVSKGIRDFANDNRGYVNLGDSTSVEIYIPKDADGNPIPLKKQIINGQDIPLPAPEAEGRPHTVLGGKISSKTGELYRQSATFPGGTWPTANGHDVPWSEVHWTNHGRGDHSNPHEHIFEYNSDKGGWIRKEPTGFK